MKNYDDLTVRGKARRLRPLVIDALRQYPFTAAKIRLMGIYTNALFRVDTTGGATYVVRVCSPGWRTDDDLRSEAAWLHALDRDTDIGAPRPILARNGDFFVTGRADHVIPCRCFVMSWVRGRLLAGALTEPNLHRMGQLFARLHAYSAGFVPPAGFTRRQMNDVFARGEPPVIFDEAVRGAFSTSQWAVFERVRTAVTTAYTRLYADPAGLRVIHHDLHHENIHVYRGHLYPLDFEDTVWGYPVQDIAMALQDLMLDVPPERFDPLIEQFRAGYASLSAWPEQYDGQIDTFRAGRLLWVANYVAQHEAPYLAGYIARIAPQLERFLDTGKLRLMPT